MNKQAITFDQLPEYVCELGRKVDQLTALISSLPATSPVEEIGGIALARELTRLSQARIYALVGQRAIPHTKRGNRLTFRRSELVAWLEEGKRDQKGGADA